MVARINSGAAGSGTTNPGAAESGAAQKGAPQKGAKANPNMRPNEYSTDIKMPSRMTSLASALARVPALKGAEELKHSAGAAARADQVRAMFRTAIESLYKDAAPYVLSYVNAVYILEEKGAKTLSVYLSDPSVRSDIHNKQALILMHLKQKYGEEIEVFKTFPAKFDMRKRHAYAGAQEEAVISAKVAQAQLTDDEKKQVEAMVADVEDARMKAVLQKAISSSLVRDKFEKM